MTDLGRFRRRRAAGPAPAHRPGASDPGALPSEVVEQLRVAERLCQELADAGVELRFEAPGGGRRVRAVLVDEDGNHIRDVSLADVVELRLDGRDALGDEGYGSTS